MEFKPNDTGMKMFSLRIPAELKNEIDRICAESEPKIEVSTFVRNALESAVHLNPKELSEQELDDICAASKIQNTGTGKRTSILDDLKNKRT